MNLITRGTAVATLTALAMSLGAGTATAASATSTKPVAKLTAPHKAEVGALVSVGTKGSRVPLKVKSVVLTFGDHSKALHLAALPATKSHRYAKAGHYTVTLTVTDRGNHKAKATRTLTIVTINAQPTATSIPTLGAKLATQNVAPQAALRGGPALPDSADLTADAVQPANQGVYSSCVTYAIDYAMFGWYANKQGLSGAPFAPMFAYSQINGGTDGGSYAGDALALAQKTGEDTAADYGSGAWFDWQTKPTTAQIANAANYKIAGYHMLFSSTSGGGATGSDAIKAQLAAGRPVAIGMQVPESFRHLSGSGVYNDLTTTYVGGHEMLALGYNANGILVQNSWDPKRWGSNDFGWISWAVVGQDVDDAYTIDGLVPSQSRNDTTAPTVSAPHQTMATGSVMNQYGAPVDISWSGNGGIAGYALYASTNGAAWAQQTLPSATATSINYHLTPGSTYRFAVRGYDAAGNYSEWSIGKTFTVGDYQENGGYVTYTAGAWNYQPWDQADGGQVAESAVTGAVASFSFTGTTAAWVTDFGPTRGQVDVWLDDTYAGRVDLYAASWSAQAVGAVLNADSQGTHKVTLQVVGTSGRPTVDVDSFVVLYE